MIKWQHGSKTWGEDNQVVWVGQDKSGLWYAEIRSNPMTKSTIRSGPWPSQDVAENAICSFLNAIANEHRL